MLALNHRASLSPQLALPWDVLSHRLSPEFKTTSFLKAIHLKYVQDNTNSPYYKLKLSDAYMCTDKITLLDAEKASEFQLIKQLIKVGHISKAHLMLHT